MIFSTAGPTTYIIQIYLIYMFYICYDCLCIKLDCFDYIITEKRIQYIHIANIHHICILTMHQLLILSILTTLLPLSTSDCLYTSTPRNTQTGEVRAQINKIVNQLKQPSLYFYPLTDDIQPSANIKVATAVSGFSMEKKSKQFGFEISVGYFFNLVHGLRFTVTTNVGSTDRWNFVNVQFFVSDLEDIFVGNADALTFVNTQNPNVIKVFNHVALDNIKFNYVASPKIFISGIHLIQNVTISAQISKNISTTLTRIQELKKYFWSPSIIKKMRKIIQSSQRPSITALNPQLSNQKILSFEIYKYQSILRKLSYSYILFLQRNQNQKYYRSISGVVGVSGTANYGFQGLGLMGSSMFFGISGVKVQVGQASGLGFDARVNMGTQKAMFVVQNYDQNADVELSYIAIQYVPGAACKTCPNSPIKYQQFCVKQCPFGYVAIVNGDGEFQCTSCNIQGFLIASSDSQKCICPLGHYFVSPTQSCKPCPYSCQTCNGEICLTCAPNSGRILNRSTQRCECLQINAKGIALFDDTVNKLTKCVQCNARCKTCNGPQINNCLSCQNNRVLESGMCLCKGNFSEDSAGKCVCKGITVGGLCEASIKCRQNQRAVSIGGKISCQCQSGYFINIITNNCNKQCQSSEQFNMNSQKCECKKNSVYNPTTKQCELCPLNQYLNEINKKCECIKGFDKNKDNVCIKCPVKSYYNPINDNCDCIFNFYRTQDDGSCLKCTSAGDAPQCAGGVDGAKFS